MTGQFRSDIVAELEEPTTFTDGGWEFSSSIPPPGKTFPKRLRITATHSHPHIFVTGHDGSIAKVSASLPEVIHGYNGRQIKGQAELDESIERLQAIVLPLAEGLLYYNRVTRLDFAYHVEGDPRRILSALRNTKHPRIRLDKVEYRTNSIQLIGRKFALSIYSKSHQKSGRTGIPKAREFGPADKHLRIEVQARTKDAVSQLFGANETAFFQRLDYSRLWSGYRDFIDQLTPGNCCRERPNFSHDQLLQYCIAEGVQLPGGLLVSSWWAASQKPETIRKKYAAARKIAWSIGEFRLADLIPVSPPSNYFDVYPEQSVTKNKNHSNSRNI